MDYNGELGIIVINEGDSPFIVNQGDRIAQIVLQAVPKVIWELTDSLDDSLRDSSGFGSSGIQ